MDFGLRKLLKTIVYILVVETMVVLMTIWGEVVTRQDVWPFKVQMRPWGSAAVRTEGS